MELNKIYNESNLITMSNITEFMNTEKSLLEAQSQPSCLGAVSRSPLSTENEEKRLQALKRAEDAYQDRKSPHYRDNERFSWAVETINRKFFEDCH